MIPGPDIVIACPACGAPHRRASLRSGNTFCAPCWTDGKVEAWMLPESPRITRCQRCGGFFWVHHAEAVGSLEGWPVQGSEYDVLLERVGDQRVEVMARLRERSTLSFAEVKALLARVPVAVAQALNKHDALELVRTLRAAGASARAQPVENESPPPEPPPEWKAAPYVAHLSEQELLTALSAGLAETRGEQTWLRIRAWWAGNAPFRRKDVPWVPLSARSPEARENLRILVGLFSEEDPSERLMKAEALRELERFEEARAVLRAGFPKQLEPAAGFIRELVEQGIAELRLLPQATP
jgi:hypothetical protein